ncbi:radical SAM protein [Candidatus Micrarchaeota archaeon]|nr:radical SAM protein [Candidatus Micrarchaeota archaeon]
MKVSISYPPLEGEGTPLLSQNRQFQFFSSPTYIYPMVPASAATLLHNSGYKVVWDDGIAEEVTYSKWFTRLRHASPDFIMLETKTPVVKQHWKIINEIKQALPETKTILVGDHVTALTVESFQNSRVDFVLTGGDYDFLLLNLVDYLEGKTKKLDEGIFFREKGKVKNSGKFRLHHDLNSLPFIDRELTKWELYSVKNGNYKCTPGTYTMVGRDCWYHRCTFCSWPTLYPVFRTRIPSSLLNEISLLVENYGVKEIMDDTGCFPIGLWLEKFCNSMVEKELNRVVSLDCNMRFGALSFEQYKLMKNAGFRLLLFGLESANQKTLHRINKSLKVEQIVDSCKKAKQAGLEPHITIMFGYPWENKEEACRTLELGKLLLKKGFAETVQATVVIPYPGTPLFDECKKKDWLKTTNWSRYDMKEPVMKTPMKDEEVMGLVQEIYKVGFDPEFILRKVISIRSPSDLKFMARAVGKVMGHIRDFK